MFTLVATNTSPINIRISAIIAFISGTTIMPCMIIVIFRIVLAAIFFYNDSLKVKINSKRVVTML